MASCMLLEPKSRRWRLSRYDYCPAKYVGDACKPGQSTQKKKDQPTLQAGECCGRDRGAASVLSLPIPQRMVQLSRDPRQSSYSRLQEKSSPGKAALRASDSVGRLLALMYWLRWRDRSCSLMWYWLKWRDRKCCLKCKFLRKNTTKELLLEFRI